MLNRASIHLLMLFYELLLYVLKIHNCVCDLHNKKGALNGGQHRVYALTV